MFGKKNELQVQVEQLPDVFEDNGLALVKIEDDKVINRIISAVPQLAQAGVNVGAVAEGMQLANQGVYQAILPAGAKLVNSKDMEGAVRGFFRNKKGIAGQANWMNADSAVNKIAAANIANAAMGAAALVVGQYYMKQINGELADMNSNISKLANFQMAEYKGKVLTLMTQVKRASEFQTEILEDNNLRNEEIQGLNYSEFSKLLIFAPSKEEQDEIVKYLNDKCSVIEKTILLKKEQLATLEEYKKSIIYEYVTGKREVL